MPTCDCPANVLVGYDSLTVEAAVAPATASPPISSESGSRRRRNLKINSLLWGNVGEKAPADGAFSWMPCGRSRRVAGPYWGEQRPEMTRSVAQTVNGAP